MKIAVAGAGYVGLSLGVLFSTKYKVFIYDIVSEKVDMINQKKLPIKDKELEEYFINKSLNLTATNNYKEAFVDAEYVIICTPTNFDEDKNCFDTSSIEDIIEKVIETNDDTTIVIKSTIPIGYVSKIRRKYHMKNIFFSPEFLREGKALYDNLYPSRIVIGSSSKSAKKFASLLQGLSLIENVPVCYISSKEAEAVKLFSNSFLALRVSFFNELDTFCEIKKLDTMKVINAICLDPRIGSYYNNPSFGYGGYCLSKDTKQLLASYGNIPQNVISAIIKSNDTRKIHIANMILKKKPNVVGVYRLTMKSNSDNFRTSAVIGVIQILRNNGVNIMIYEPTIYENTFQGFEIVHDFSLFKNLCDYIIANRFSEHLNDVQDIVYSRDIFYRD